MKHTAILTVRSYECDSYNHVNNAVYLNYLEYARMEFLRAINFDYEGIVAAGYYLYVTHIDIFYKASAVLGDKLFIDVEPIKTKAMSGIFRQLVRKEDGTICATAEVSWACVTKEGRPAPIPKEFMVEGMMPTRRTE